MTSVSVTYEAGGRPALKVYRDGRLTEQVALEDGALAQLVAEGAIILRHLTQTRGAA